MKMGILNVYTYLPVVALIVGIGFVFFAKDVYRYPCQDPVNWSASECEPPICNASGVCTSSLITIDGEKITTEQLSAMVNEIESSQAAVGIKSVDAITEEQPLYKEVQ